MISSMVSIGGGQPKGRKHAIPKVGWTVSKHFLKSRLRRMPLFSKERTLTRNGEYPWSYPCPCRSTTGPTRGYDTPNAALDRYGTHILSGYGQALSRSSLTSVPLNASGPAANPRCFLAWVYISWARKLFQGKTGARGVCKHQFWKASLEDGPFRFQIVCQKAWIAFKASWFEL